MSRLIKSEVMEVLPNLRKIEGVTYELFEEECKIVITFPRRSYRRGLELFSYMTCDPAIVVKSIIVNGCSLPQLVGVWKSNDIREVMDPKIIAMNKIIIETESSDDIIYECGCLYYIEGVESDLEVLDRLKSDV